MLLYDRTLLVHSVFVSVVYDSDHISFLIIYAYLNFFYN